MTEEASDLYGTGARALQEHFDARRLADRLKQVTVKESIDEKTAAYLERATYFFLATVDEAGFPDVSYKGGRSGFVRVLDEHTIRFPSYDSNGMFRSLGNIQETGRVALLFIRQNEKANRIRVHGNARVLLSASALEQFEGSEAVVEVHVSRVFLIARDISTIWNLEPSPSLLLAVTSLPLSQSGRSGRSLPMFSPRNQSHEGIYNFPSSRSPRYSSRN